jgi:hypothetical protein
MYGQWHVSDRLINYCRKEMRIEIRTFDFHHIQALK